MLSWHYRSRYETLISYSNHAFYDAGLLTIPDKTIHQRTRPLTEVQHPEEANINVSSLFNGSISFHYLPEGVYENRNNVHAFLHFAVGISALSVGSSSTSFQSFGQSIYRLAIIV